MQQVFHKCLVRFQARQEHFLFRARFFSKLSALRTRNALIARELNRSKRCSVNLRRNTSCNDAQSRITVLRGDTKRERLRDAISIAQRSDGGRQRIAKTS
jgi:hypothetical protein